MLRKALAGLVLVMAVCLLPALAIDSGLDVGSGMPAYHPQHVAGPDRGTTTCPV